MLRRVKHYPFLIPVVLLAGCAGEDVQNCAALRKGSPDKALEHCNRAVESRLVWSTERARVRIERGVILAARRDWDGAIRDFTRAFDSGRLEKADQVIALHSRGAAHIGKGEHEAAIADLDAALKLDPKAAAAQRLRSWIRQQRGQTD